MNFKQKPKDSEARIVVSEKGFLSLTIKTGNVLGVQDSLVAPSI